MYKDIYVRSIAKNILMKGKEGDFIRYWIVKLNFKNRVFYIKIQIEI